MHATDPRLKELIKSEQFHRFPGSTVVACVIVTKCGQQLVGHSIGADGAEFDLEEGRRRARHFCMGRLAALESYRERFETGEDA